ncbi:MAG: TIGR03905 family TSCPD domain-containing protein [Oscillospiraceae bacterium]|nr:TIGR03905 family TSCPD domain-containing protein [Oscillospiraceae bacterium]
MHYTCSVRGVCSRTVSFDLDENNIVSNVEFLGGCHGNLQGIALLADGRSAEELIDLLEGVRCGFKATSCPDQFANALRNTLEEKALLELK